jgi:hypothetical protein
MWKWQCWAAWTSFSDLGLELTTTFNFQCLTLRSGGGKYGSFLVTTPMRCSPRSWVAAPSLNPNGGTGGPERPLQAMTPT